MSKSDQLVLYGIGNCDSCRKARKWLDEHAIEFIYHDVRADGLEIQMLERWSQRVDWIRLLNTRSKTWRDLPTKQRDNIDKSKAMAAMLKHPTLVKRPVLECNAFVVLGYSADNYQSLLAKMPR